MKPSRANLLFIHQSADLYGSDNVLLSLIRGLDRERYHPIVVLPQKGPLVEKLEALDTEIHLLPLVLAGRKLFTLRYLISAPRRLHLSLKILDKHFRDRDIKLVHSNTLAVLSGAFWAKKRRIPHLWHVHEMITTPRIASRIFAFLSNRYAQAIVCNSRQTAAVLQKNHRGIYSKLQVILNGIPVLECADDAAEIRRHYNIREDELLIALVGRINRWKGQKLLVRAAGILNQRGIRKLRYLIVGDPPKGQNEYLQRLQKSIEFSGVSEIVQLEKFQECVARIWKACDICVVPSTEPEPFGLVAVEAMQFGKPVVAADHGGLQDIVIHQKTGLKFKPGDASALADALAWMLVNPNKRIEFGKAAYRRYREEFSEERFTRQFNRLYQEMIQR